MLMIPITGSIHSEDFDQQSKDLGESALLRTAAMAYSFPEGELKRTGLLTAIRNAVAISAGSLVTFVDLV